MFEGAKGKISRFCYAPSELLDTKLSMVSVRAVATVCLDLFETRLMIGTIDLTKKKYPNPSAGITRRKFCFCWLPRYGVGCVVCCIGGSKCSVVRVVGWLSRLSQLMCMKCGPVGLLVAFSSVLHPLEIKRLSPADIVEQ